VRVAGLCGGQGARWRQPQIDSVDRFLSVFHNLIC
jgi:hypothetical protein